MIRRHPILDAVVIALVILGVAIVIGVTTGDGAPGSATPTTDDLDDSAFNGRRSLGTGIGSTKKHFVRLDVAEVGDTVAVTTGDWYTPDPCVIGATPDTFSLERTQMVEVEVDEACIKASSIDERLFWELRRRAEKIAEGRFLVRAGGRSPLLECSPGAGYACSATFVSGLYSLSIRSADGP
jgi:hypothetical protein